MSDRIAECRATPTRRPPKRAKAAKCQGKRSRRKGHDLEREVANLLAAIYPDAARRPQGRGARDGCDVENTPWWVEAKRRRKAEVATRMAEAEAEADGRPVLLVVRVDNDTRPIACVRWEDFEELLRRAGGAV